ncbi:MAG: hypothetical protein AAF492_24935, partial [Verrucomicrobiota bacterium]
IAPLVVSVIEPIHDEFGLVLEGNAAYPGDLVQILEADTSIDPAGVIHPPNLDGTPHPANPVLAGGVTAVGAHTPVSLSRPGFFGHAMLRTQAGAMNGRKIFVRVFNAANLSEASFYGESTRIFTVRDNKVFLATIDDVDRPLDAADNDGDGLNNSWEESLGTDPDNNDTDGDGMNDGAEWIAGTDATDPEKFLAITHLEPQGDHLVVKWPSMVGRRYILEHTYEPLGPGTVFTPISQVLAHATQTEVTVSNALLDPYACCLYRVIATTNAP